jgi:zinc transporter
MTELTELTGLISGHQLDAKGGGSRLRIEDLAGDLGEGSTAEGPLAELDRAHAGGVSVLHFDRTKPATRAWLATQTEIPPAIGEALLEEDTRPRCVFVGTGMMMILRGINFDRERNSEDTVALRIWATEKRLVVLTRYRVLAVEDMTQNLDAGQGATDVASYLVALIEGLTSRLAPEVDRMEEALDVVEERALEGTTQADRRDLVRIRRKALILHRYLHPQREALQAFRDRGSKILPTLDPHDMTETAERVTRIVEDLQALRDRAQIVEDGISIRVAEKMNRNMYWLSIVATIFMPLGFVTGLLGVNVLGIPGSEDGHAFAILCGLLALMAAFELWIMRRMRLF